MKRRTALTNRRGHTLKPLSRRRAASSRRDLFGRASVVAALSAVVALAFTSVVADRAHAQSGWATEALPDFSTSTTVEPNPSTSPSDGADAQRDLGGRAQIALQAVLFENGPQILDGLIWRVFRLRPGTTTNFELANSRSATAPTFDLAAGKYFVNASYGLAHVTLPLELGPGERKFEQLTLNAGGLELTGIEGASKPIPNRNVRYAVYSDEFDQSGNRELIVNGVTAGTLLRLNAGLYHVVSTYGTANATSAADVSVEAGKLTRVTMHHDAIRVTLKLVSEPGGEALAGTRWQIFAEGGDLVKETAGALPTQILAAGSYRISAIRRGQRFEASFDLVAGTPRELEVIAQ